MLNASMDALTMMTANRAIIVEQAIASQRRVTGKAAAQVMSVPVVSVPTVSAATAAVVEHAAHVT